MPKKIEEEEGKQQISAAQCTYEAMWSEEERVFIARVGEFPSLEARGDSRGSSLRALRSVVDSVVKDLAESSQEIPRKAGQKKGSQK
jgi:predicted RNase H-like HicB family nuclease